jgi:hypothetical protein
MKDVALVVVSVKDPQPLELPQSEHRSPVSLVRQLSGICLYCSGIPKEIPPGVSLASTHHDRRDGS